ncbi:cysteine-rich receptor-like protein kinase 29 isoform X2 [Cucumis sativus]|uniref:cysteine-rich receptor-like protein kinase 29 isoform X2 n=1 Tax=Cucumis sativus TaxID=3659 RepID=UPI0012F51D55|nr:cysteine-rich receptor-like protein kinase 29 isoform X2 [Cucumis sativus]
MGSLCCETPFFMVFFILVLVVQHSMFPTTNSQPDFTYHSCSNNANYTNNSPFKKNLHNVLLSISSKTTQLDYGLFYNATSGEYPDRATALALCRGGVSLKQCRSCVYNSTLRITKDCPKQREAEGWYSDCQIRYSNNSIYGVLDTTIKYVRWNTQKALNPRGFNKVLRSLFDGLGREAASGSSVQKSAWGDKKVPSSNVDIVYGLVDCFPDLSYLDCLDCLNRLQNFLRTCCNDSMGVRIFGISCQLNYDNTPIYPSLLSSPSLPPSPLPSSSPTPVNSSSTGRSRNKSVAVLVVVAIVPTIILLVAIFIILILRKRKHKRPLDNFEGASLEDTVAEISSVEMVQFDFDSIKAATNNFASENKLGQGGFGVVYKGRLGIGRPIAVKRLAINSQQGDLEFKNEVLLVLKLQHRNLVRLLGFCLQGSERLLIYEFIPNGSLDSFIFDLEKRTQLDWKRRYKIINGIARGLLYLHEDSRFRIIHRDLKASNILLDQEMNAKIGDFGMAKLFDVDQTQGNTNRVVGTFGYMAPEYVKQGHFSVKSDVFSFGILVLEIVSGKKNNNSHSREHSEDLSSFVSISIISFLNSPTTLEATKNTQYCDFFLKVWTNWRAGTTTNVIDSTLTVGSRTDMERCIHIGLLCIQENAVDRPTMNSVVTMLSSSSLSLPLPRKPAFFLHSATTNNNIASGSDGNRRGNPSIQPSINNLSITQIHPR